MPAEELFFPVHPFNVTPDYSMAVEGNLTLLALVGGGALVHKAEGIGTIATLELHTHMMSTNSWILRPTP